MKHRLIIVIHTINVSFQHIAVCNSLAAYSRETFWDNRSQY
jgi:hypothetical protein